MRLAVIGDELVAGTGDSRGLGWVGRVLARSEFTDPPTLMPLPWPGETTRELSARWEGEAAARLSQGGPRGLIIGIGTADVTAGTSSARSRLNLANITDRATTLGIPCFVVGPPPLAGADAQATKELSRSCAEVCLRRGLPFVDLYAPLVAHDQWLEGPHGIWRDPSGPIRLRPHGLARPALGVVRMDGSGPARVRRARRPALAPPRSGRRPNAWAPLSRAWGRPPGRGAPSTRGSRPRYRRGPGRCPPNRGFPHRKGPRSLG